MPSPFGQDPRIAAWGRRTGISNFPVQRPEVQDSVRPPAEDPYGKLGEAPKPEQKDAMAYVKQVDINSLPSMDKIIGYDELKLQMDILSDEFAATINANKILNTNSKTRAEAESYLKRHGGVHDPMFNVFLNGVSGTGKSTVIGALARELQAKLGTTKLTVWKLETGLIRDGVVGESQKRMTTAINAVLSGPQPAFLIIDESDSLFATNVHGVHEVTLQVTNIFKDKMMEMVGKKSIMVAMATNNIDKIDDAIKTPHRTRVIGVKLPSPDVKYRMMDDVIDNLGLPCSIPMSEREQIARNLRSGKAAGTHFKGLERALREARTAIIKGVESGRISVIRQKKVGKETIDVLLQPKEHSAAAERNKARDVAHARSRTHIDSSTGMGAERFGLRIKDDGTRITSVEMVELTKTVLDFAVGNFEGSISDDLESLANAK